MNKEDMAPIRGGFTYLIETIKDGVVVDREVVHNLVPVAALNDCLSVWLKGGAQSSAWYAGVYKNNYTPLSTDTAATFPGAGVANESTAYSESTRRQVTLGTIAGGAVDNSASKAEFTANDTETWYGMFISSISTKGSTSGTMISAVKFSAPKVVDAGTVLQVTAGFAFTSA